MDTTTLAWTGGEVGCAAAVLAAWAAGRLPRRPASAEELAAEEYAYLTGGPARVAEVALVRMQQAGLIGVSRASRVTVHGDADADDVPAVHEELVAAASGKRDGATVARVREAVAAGPAVAALRGALAARGLVHGERPDAAHRRWTALAAAGLAGLVACGVLGTVLPSASAPRTPLLAVGAVLLCVSALLAVRLARASGRPTREGRGAVGALLRRSPWTGASEVPEKRERARLRTLRVAALGVHEGLNWDAALAAALLGKDYRAPAGRPVGRAQRAGGAGGYASCGSPSSSHHHHGGGGGGHHSCGGGGHHG
ncbi:hypothetical protein BIV57_20850 [Mangrovactinospora gilvigrisea]|uniref:TIGR04222 domain-containing membrane protein n=1 Tax=Mangrovactinospora gilvigrisea TaxID=1428644 RepID=A0A1J7BAE9_9ACTN|nr:TIGR04222 domain-containing membrane protein [Mangrovactinospora gilvigrisea]OIV35573.1 hypothetical protein BIV57_20850 [Mangrovactinospora gilvigrisea]